MKPTVLVITTVHSPDDTRIRERLVRTLSENWIVVYGTRSPGPTDSSGLLWVPLRGGRPRRNVDALRLLLREDWDVAVVHDPELIPVAAIGRLVRRRPVVFDVHEDVPAQIAVKTWIPRLLRRPLAWLATRLLFFAESSLTLSLAEPGYQGLFRELHVVFPNYPHYPNWSEPVAMGNGSAVYIGDVQEARGLLEAIEACGQSGTPLLVIGPYSTEIKSKMHQAASRWDAKLTLQGPVPNPEAIKLLSHSSVGLSPLLSLPNYVRSLPTKTLEYLAMGVPVVATDLPGTREALEALDAVWLVPPGDTEAMIRGIRAAISDEARAAAFAQAPSIRERYFWPSAEVAQFFEDLISP